MSNISSISKFSDNNDILIKENLDEDKKSENILLIKNKYIYIYNLEKNEVSKVDIYKIKENDENNNGILFENHKLIFKKIINLKDSLSNKKIKYNILLWNEKSDLIKLLNLLNDKKIENNKKYVNRINIGENKIIEENKNYDSDNINNNDNSDESFDYLLNKDNSSHKNSNHTLFNTGIMNNKFYNNNIYSSFNGSEPINEREIDNDKDIDIDKDNGNDKEIYVYISDKGRKYHSKSICRKKELSKRVSLKSVKEVGFTLCTFCKFD